MKRFYATLALLGAMITGANAQIADISIKLVSPTPAEEQTAAYNIPCTDSFRYEFYVINNGPATVTTTDTIFFISPFAPTGQVNYFKPAANAAATDTIAHFGGYMVKNDIERLADPTDGTWLYAPFANGDYAMVFQFAAFSDNSTLEDTSAANDADFSFVTINCGTGVKDVNFSKAALNIFPNPAQNQISFTNDFATTSTAVVKITDIAGRVVKSIDLGKQNAGSKTYNVDIAELHNGMYYIELVTDNTRSISKFTKN